MRNRFTTRQQIVASVVAYLFALNALLVAWVAAPAPAQGAFDALSITCLTITPDGKPATGTADHNGACPCASACVGMSCCAGGAPIAELALRLPWPKAIAAISPDGAETGNAPARAGPHSARGPPIFD